ncbi:MAG TPA: MAPEG family protein [Steroidobacteraceae bacterium]|jgi:glutathione S-transferase|nr:MAPEG family protein [Steroidobacteraceae bacterium]
MPLVHLVVGLALLEFFLFGFAVARARGRYQVPAPATHGNEVFERYFRVQMNTLEQLVIFVPSILVFARYFGAYLAAALGVLFIIGRAIYFRGYVRAPEQRSIGFALSALPNVVLLLGAIIGAVRALAVG